MKNNKILNNSGFTLVEIMVSVGLLAIVSMSLINLYDFFGKSVRKTNADYLIEEIETKINYMITDKAACDNTLAGRTVPLDYIAPSSSAATNIVIRDYNNNIVLSENNLFNYQGQSRTTFLPTAPNASVALLRVNKIYVHDFNQINTQEYETTNWRNYSTKTLGYRKGYIRLTIEFDVKDVRPDGQPADWGRKISKDILLGIVLERSGGGDVVVECSDYKDTAMATSIKNICDDLDGTITYNNGQMFCAGTQQSLLRELRLNACRYLPFFPIADGRGYAHNCMPNTNGSAVTSGPLSPPPIHPTPDPDFYSCKGDKITGIAHFNGDGDLTHHIFTCKNWMSP